MITLFRRIRQKLIASGSVTKYLLYAIGEILLVVVGILIALQVNDWNEEKKARIEERVLLENLKNDFEIRYNELVEFSEIRNLALSGIDTLAVMINKPEAILPTDEMDKIFANLNNLIQFNDQFKVLDVLFSTGKIDRISNQELKTKLLNWPQNVEEMMEEQRIRYDIFSSYLLPLQYRYLAIRHIFEKFNFRGYEYPKGTPAKKVSDYRGLLSDPNFENYLAQAEVLYRINGHDYSILTENAERIIDLLKLELEN